MGSSFTLILGTSLFLLLLVFLHLGGLGAHGVSVMDGSSSLACINVCIWLNVAVSLESSEVLFLNFVASDFYADAW